MWAGILSTACWWSMLFLTPWGDRTQHYTNGNLVYPDWSCTVLVAFHEAAERRLLSLNPRARVKQRGCTNRSKVQKKNGKGWISYLRIHFFSILISGTWMWSLPGSFSPSIRSIISRSFVRSSTSKYFIQQALPHGGECFGIEEPAARFQPVRRTWWDRNYQNLKRVLQFAVKPELMSYYNFSNTMR